MAELSLHRAGRSWDLASPAVLLHSSLCAGALLFLLTLRKNTLVLANETPKNTDRLLKNKDSAAFRRK